MNQLVDFTDRTPALAAAADGERAYRVFEFFTARIRNARTRGAYIRAVDEIVAR